MDISVIVVSYNVRAYLSLCLDSLRRAMHDLSGEIIVVDNCSEDRSAEYLKDHYPDVSLIANSSNVGFGKACNQGLEVAAGEYVLFINPDTIIPEDLLSKGIQFLQGRPEAGALGVQLIDGVGCVLRESKRSIPTFWSSICKFSGLSDGFPNVPFLNGYYAPELRYEDIGEIDVLPGAFMLIRRDILIKLQGFDPQFFMYAEDIDLSYRIQKSGYKILYNGTLKAVHFKGESTRKSLVEYTDTFFSSMKLFIDKYRGELYGNFESNFLSNAVHILLLVKRYWSKVRKNKMPGKDENELPEFSDALLLSPEKGHLFLLKDKFSFQKLSRVPDSDEGLPGAVHLRYIIPFLWTRKRHTIIMDTNGLTFSQIIKIMNQSGKGIEFWLSDFQKGFMLSSIERDRQGTSFQL